MLDSENSAFDVAVAVSATGGCVQEWSITLNDQTIHGSSEESRDNSIAAMMNTQPGSECTIPGIGTIRVPHPQAAMAAAVMMLDTRHSYYLTHSVRLVPDSREIREFLHPFFVC